MSAEDFSKLSLGEMVTTRAGAARARTEPLQPNSSSSSSASSPRLIESTSGIKYNIAVLDDEARRRAELALGDNEIKMKYCTQSGEELKVYFFHIDDDITVRMGAQFNVPKCNCGANEGGVACKHIYWIEDQLTSGAPQSIRSENLQLATDGATVHNIQPAHMIDRMTLERVVEGLDWVLHDSTESDDEDAEEDLAELLSVFEPSGALPTEFKSLPDSPTLSERSRKYKEFSDVVSKYATENLGLLNRLHAIIDPAFQAHTFFDKINDRIARTFKALDEYIEHGPTDTQAESYDVVTCAAKLKDLEKMIEEYYKQEIEENPGSKDIAIRASASLISILDGVSKRNYDAYANITWAGIPPMDPAQNNLFTRLIEAPVGNGGLFVLDALIAFPKDDVLRNHWEILSKIDENLSQSDTPPRFMSTFRAITSESRKRTFPEAGGSSAKRAMK
ncbi:hypothetical protein K469DRAFT_169452 [Zopfia rhizophila CBS 207.26]|uniref:SWIM-type domain-containing protein n=1 Tax=Zopfia rhizophila CBS 207.26 TaxID=1314779 RepID=A0A6A6DZF2_9PEZI|nr:hypothetical protein K469DRAFT_169452 [Zopfia rhizophila CBS 207.26]